MLVVIKRTQVRFRSTKCIINFCFVDESPMIRDESGKDFVTVCTNADVYVIIAVALNDLRRRSTSEIINTLWVEMDCGAMFLLR